MKNKHTQERLNGRVAGYYRFWILFHIKQLTCDFQVNYLDNQKPLQFINNKKRIELRRKIITYRDGANCFAEKEKADRAIEEAGAQHEEVTLLTSITDGDRRVFSAGDLFRDRRRVPLSQRITSSPTRASSHGFISRGTSSITVE
jgi:hypothetical protein